MAALDDVVNSVQDSDKNIENTWREFKPRIIRKYFRDRTALAVDCASDGNSNDGDGGDVVEVVGKSPESNSPFVWDVEVMIRNFFFNVR